jgi:enterochelin esterase family protein
VGPVEPGVWEYSFIVDGLRMIDPGNPAIKPMRRPRTSMLHLPADPPAWVDFQAVPHGVVHLHTYRSRPLGLVRKLRVYTPPGYAAGVAAGRRYPTLYLQHGTTKPPGSSTARRTGFSTTSLPGIRPCRKTGRC